nr:TetR-like C-terminal domain-containing protein [Kibdelosporangium sp. MJ126-NF4]CEL17178.1 Transcriptional regulator, TetR family [Kibdelosporangium sp. MJ126-NF4]CTQ91592.1 Transcriptional regulator, TetR family [Kibdelosporangium sp. MJ126-NF4]
MTATRRRGDSLCQAIYLVTLAELARTSFADLTFDKLATLAATGKASLYRRWSTPQQLVLAALTDPSTGFGEAVAPDTGALRDDLLDILGQLARALDEPRGRALRPLLSERISHPELYDEIRRRVIQPHHLILVGILRAAADRGEAEPRSVTPRVAAVGPKLVIAESLEKGTVGPADVQAIVDEVLLPLTEPRR